MSAKKLFKFQWNVGRMGDVAGLFVSTDEAVADAIGKKVYLGEALGKHSEIYGELKAEDVTVLSDDSDFAEKFATVMGRFGSFGYNPLDYIEEDSPDEEDEEDE